MKKMKIRLEYKGYPIWVYDELGEFIGNDLIDELEEATEVKELLEDIQDIYDALFIDDAIQFEYKGFRNDVEKDKFLHKVERVVQLIEEKVGDRYSVENKVAL